MCRLRNCQKRIDSMKKNMVLSNICRVVIFFLIIAIGCVPPVSKSKVFIRMMDSQEKYFRDSVISSFSKIDIPQVISYTSVDSIEDVLKNNAGAVSLIKIPFGKAWSLVRKRKIIPLHSFLSPIEIREFNDTYIFTSLGRQFNKQYFIPRKYETRLMVYLKSKVREAYGLWKVYEDTIDIELKKYNGFGLPNDYTFEISPEMWDFYDLFVVGWIWANEREKGYSTPKIAHRGKHYSGTSHRIIDRIFQLGGDSSAVITMNGDAVIDAFYWEAVYADANIFNPKMWEEEWSGADIWKGFKTGEVFLSFMTQLDCFFLHGTGMDGLTGFLSDSSDMGVATMPAGCTFLLDGNGSVLQRGHKSITSGGWWWGIPSDAPDPKMSYRIARYITNKENQVEGCNRFGMIPVRKDVRESLDSLFTQNWIREVYDASYRQMVFNQLTTVPAHNCFHKIADVYLDAWFDIVANKNWSTKKNGIPDRFYIKKVLDIKYVSAVKRIK